MELDPAWRGGDRLPTILRTPSFDETHPNRAHSRQLVNGFEPLTYASRQKSRELLIIKDLKITAGGYLADGRGMPSVSLIAIG